MCHVERWRGRVVDKRHDTGAGASTGKQPALLIPIGLGVQLFRSLSFLNLAGYISKYCNVSWPTVVFNVNGNPLAFSRLSELNL